MQALICEQLPEPSMAERRVPRSAHWWVHDQAYFKNPKNHSFLCIVLVPGQGVAKQADPGKTRRYIRSTPCAPINQTAKLLSICFCLGRGWLIGVGQCIRVRLLRPLRALGAVSFACWHHVPLGLFHALLLPMEELLNCSCGPCCLGACFA